MKKAVSNINEEIIVSDSDTEREVKTIKENCKTTVVYIGPTIENIVTQNIVFNNGIPQYLREEMLKQPLISNLIVPIGQLAGARSELRNPQSTLSIVYNKIKTK
ncbi:hypothetical protein C8E03_110120 [Lachnotalea glycerini]|uniref:Uncharacterized protein n=1 Tax=Lachnotalea glycerini TaxID=1763509 RepID=A0A318ENN2_9FIRM|nr:hypothetical protein [Lachnotalea glycerini]OYP43550.1 hypothetical protein CG709_04395 [Lachnotalea glycerini]PXV87359.1 hypothetical protein C8E03_110120 [Lachnotalea glycerini]